MNVTIGLTRHFETDWNAAKRLQGRTDRPLTATARARAAALRPPPEWAGARLIATPLARSEETAKLLTGAAPEIEPALIELSWGVWEGRRGADLLADASSGYAHVETWGWGKCPPGGESPEDAWARIAPALARIAAANQPALMVLHRGVMRVILAKAWGWNFDRVEPFRIKRERIYPVTLDEAGVPVAHGPEARLIAR
ncbi:histidine phosphatase family protein [Pikeienuella piscinae]|uniref:Histidine phosphatase family protein n=1 Tax=Pikeienuella piscinae TaxID=2748098 RepID=A0A7M3T595_9RHOB|nr:histidine phosphatase family protein [Pikeienuella piscinae]QIE57176.1 histidine phosphatase family protein [Pikeienuella piscinae]